MSCSICIGSQRSSFDDGASCEFSGAHRVDQAHERTHFFRDGCLQAWNASYGRTIRKPHLVRRHNIQERNMHRWLLSGLTCAAAVLLSAPYTYVHAQELPVRPGLIAAQLDSNKA